MLERIINHPSGRFLRCRQCQQQPRHVTATGRTSSEPVQFTPAPTRHSPHCSCGARTARHETLAATECEWGADYAQQMLPLRLARRRRSIAA